MRPVSRSLFAYSKRSFSSDRIVPASDVSRPRLIRDASFLEADWKEIAERRGGHNRLGFAYQGSIKIRGVKRRDRLPAEARADVSRSTFGRSIVETGSFDPTDFDASLSFGSITAECEMTL